MGRDKNDVKGNPMISSGLYVLKHKDLDVAMVQIDRASGKIEYVPDIFLPEELPPGVGEDSGRIAAWRSEERRVGKECIRACRSRGAAGE